MRSLILITTLMALGTLSLHSKTLVYFGTYTDEGSEGIYVATLDETNGQLSEAKLAAKVDRPPFLVLHPSGSFLYCISEVDRAPSVNSFAIELDGTLQPINTQPAPGIGPCHISLDQTGAVLLMANYGDGSINSYPLAEGGSIGAPASHFQHTGSSIDPRRQTGPHAHSINVDPSNQHAFVADLGLDQIRIYDLDPATAKLAPSSTPFLSTPPGGGPRHLSFHPSGKFAYANLEMSSQVIALAHDTNSGSLRLLQTLTSLPANADPTGNSTAETLVHPSGKFLYVSNRGHNSIAIYRIDQSNGQHAYLGDQPSGGQIPRGFGLSPAGDFLIVAHQKSNNVVTFRIEPQTGLLTQTGTEITVPTAVCVRFLKRR